MSFTPNAPFGTGANVTATVDSTIANFGATNFPHSPNFAISETSTAEYLLSLNNANIGKTVPHS